MLANDGSLIIFNQGVGYGMVIGIGAGFALVMVSLSKLLSRFMNEIQDSEMMSTAKRSVRTGLVASSVVSSWTIGSTLLLSCTTTYELGISAAWWYGAGACVQIIIFSCFSIDLKRKCPNAHTFQEILRVRYGRAAHLTMCSYSFVQQLFYTANLLVNGSSIFANITGMNREAATVLLPLFVMVYTLMGGIKATFMTDWTHVVIIYVLMLTFLFKAYVTSDLIGSPGKMWDLLTEAANKYPVEGNLNGSLLTFTSYNGGLFGLILFGTGFSAAVDSQLFQKAIAADPMATLGGYTFGGICWFTLPYALATTMGLACRALEITPQFPTYPERLSSEQLSNGLVLPISAYVLMGKGGAAAILLMVMMACTAAFSSEVIAVGSLWTYDLYRPYINPDADGKKLLMMTHAGVTGFTAIVIGLAIGLGRANFDVSFITTCLGIIVNVCIIPMALTLYWRKMSGFAFVATTTLSTGVSIAVWLGYAHSAFGEVSLASLNSFKALAAGNTVAIFLPIVFVPFFVWIKHDDFDWNIWKTEVHQVDDSKFASEHGLTNILSGEEVTEMVLEEESEIDARMKRRRNIGVGIATLFVLFFLILFPLPLYGSHRIFSKSFFTGYIVVTFIWAFLAAGFIIIYPLAESWRSIVTFFVRVAQGRRPSSKLYDDRTVEHVTSVVSRRSRREVNEMISPVMDVKMDNILITKDEVSDST